MRIARIPFGVFRPAVAPVPVPVVSPFGFLKITPDYPLSVSFKANGTRSRIALEYRRKVRKKVKTHVAIPPIVAAPALKLRQPGPQLRLPFVPGNQMMGFAIAPDNSLVQHGNTGLAIQELHQRNGATAAGAAADDQAFRFPLRARVHR